MALEGFAAVKRLDEGHFREWSGGIGWEGSRRLWRSLREAATATEGVAAAEDKGLDEIPAAKKMTSRVARRVIHFANLPIKLLMPTSFNNIKEIALKTIPSASKIEIKRVLESLYGFEVEEVRTLNMEGKKKKRGGILIAKPDYKKAYVTLRSPLSISSDLYPLRIIEEERKKISKQSESSMVDEQESKSHWLDGSGNKPEKQSYVRAGRANQVIRGNQGDRSRGGDRGNRGNRDAGTAKFPWSSMPSPK